MWPEALCSTSMGATSGRKQHNEVYNCFWKLFALPEKHRVKAT